MSWSRSVFSKMVQEIAYDDDAQEMIVTWNSGRTSIYSGVPEDVALSVANAPSVGQAMNQEIKPNYNHRYA
jgi:hypothetical protein